MTAASARLSFKSFGPEGAPTIIFLHGGGAAGWMWEPVIAHLPGYHCLAPDLPQHGASAAVGPFSIPFAAQLTAALIREQARGGTAVVVGLSEGAQVAVELLAQAPTLLEKAVVSSALLRPIPGARLLTPGVMRWSYKLGIAPLKNSDFWIRLNMKHAAGIPEEYYAQFKRDFQAMTESGFTNLMVANQQFRLPAGLEKVYVPTLVVAGEHEYPAMKQSARDLASAMPRAKAVLVRLSEKSTLAEEHNWALVQPALFAQTVQAWVEDQELPRELVEME